MRFKVWWQPIYLVIMGPVFIFASQWPRNTMPKLYVALGSISIALAIVMMILNLKRHR